MEYDLEDIIHAISIKPECIKNAQSESERLEEHITPDMVAIEAIGMTIKSMIEDKLHEAGKAKHEAYYDV